MFGGVSRELERRLNQLEAAVTQAANIAAQAASAGAAHTAVCDVRQKSIDDKLQTASERLGKIESQNSSQTKWLISTLVAALGALLLEGAKLYLEHHP